jgi:hypothetical protein
MGFEEVKLVDYVAEIRRYIRMNHKNMSHAARAIGVSPAFLSAVIRRNKKPSDKVMEAVGIERRTVVAYFRKAEPAKNATARIDGALVDKQEG